MQNLLSQKRQLSREQVTGTIILACLMILILTVGVVNLLDVKVLNIEQVDHGLYTVITSKGLINVLPEDILRIERTYVKATVTGRPVELDKIYTNKGFIYISSLDSFAYLGKQLINSVDYEGKPIWERGNTTEETVQPYAFAIGTPLSQVPIVFLGLTLQYLALSIGGVALAVLIFPLRWEEGPRGEICNQPEQEFRSQEEKPLGAAAK
ncbi:MAG: hypothetical protein ACYCVD_05800 [Desulfitobacteriaceae bacterium]